MKLPNGYVGTTCTPKVLSDLGSLKLRTTLKTKLKDGSQEVDILRWMSRTALELIGQSGMGYSFDKLAEEDASHPYSESMKKFRFVVNSLVQDMSWLFSSILTGGPFGFFSTQYVFPLAAKFHLPRVKRFIVEHIPWKRIQEIKDSVDVMHNTSLEIIQTKKDALNNTNLDAAKEMLEKKDIISILSKPL